MRIRTLSLAAYKTKGFILFRNSSTNDNLYFFTLHLRYDAEWQADDTRNGMRMARLSDRQLWQAEWHASRQAEWQATAGFQIQQCLKGILIIFTGMIFHISKVILLYQDV